MKLLLFLRGVEIKPLGLMGEVVVKNISWWISKWIEKYIDFRFCHVSFYLKIVFVLHRKLVWLLREVGIKPLDFSILVHLRCVNINNLYYYMCHFYKYFCFTQKIKSDHSQLSTSVNYFQCPWLVIDCLGPENILLPLFI